MICLDNHKNKPAIAAFSPLPATLPVGVFYFYFYFILLYNSCLGMHVHPWWIHVNVWQNQYVSLRGYTSVVHLSLSLLLSQNREWSQGCSWGPLTLTGIENVCQPSLDEPLYQLPLENSAFCPLSVKICFCLKNYIFLECFCLGTYRCFFSNFFMDGDFSVFHSFFVAFN